MARWFLLLVALVLVAIGSLTAVKSPIWSKWQLAVAAGEFGHWLALAPWSLVVTACVLRGPLGSLWLPILGLSGLALGLLLKPSAQAWALGRTLPARLNAAFGPADLARRPFSPAAFWALSPRPIPPRTLRYADQLALDFYPAVGRGRAPCVIVIHGGGWDSGDKDQLPCFNHWLAGRGYAVAAISYRLAPQFVWPAQRDDILAALAFLKSQAADLEIDATRLALLGRSAGGNLAETVGYAVRDPAIRGVVALYAPADLEFAWKSPANNDPLNSPLLMRQFLGGSPETRSAAFAASSGINFVDRSAPPTLLLHGQLDPLVWYRQSERLADRLRAAGVPHVFVSLPWATHAFEFNLNGPGGQLATYAVEWFLAAATTPR